MWAIFGNDHFRSVCGDLKWPFPRILVILGHMSLCLQVWKCRVFRLPIPIYWSTVSSDSLDVKICPLWPIWHPITCAFNPTWLASFSIMEIFDQICRLLCHHLPHQFSIPITWAALRLASGRWTRTRCLLEEWLKVFDWLFEKVLYFKGSLTVTHQKPIRITENPLAALDDAETQKQETWARGRSNFTRF